MRPFFRYGFLVLLVLGGCAASPSQSASRDRVAISGEAPIAMESFPEDKGDLDQLARLWKQRSQENPAADYPVGPGDVIEVSVPAIEELRGRVVRIAGDGMIAMPFVGKIQAAGLTEDELRQRLAERLLQYMYDPRVVVFVREYRSRQVAVLGAVTKPGLYSLSSSSDTLLDMISQAGGIQPGADPRIYLVPAEPAEPGQAKQLIATLPQSLLQQDPAPLLLKRTDPIVIDTKELAVGGYQQYLALAVRPGDIIMVPGGGQVLVEGWVEKPGAYKVSPGLTVAGVVGEAGGPLYPADVSAVKVIRTDKAGKKNFVLVDLQKIKRGDAPDITLQGGDIVEMPAESSKLIQYGLYRFFTTVVNVGVGASIPFK